MNQIIEKENIENLIYEVRGRQVMLDSDLARLYRCSNGTKTINQSVKRHINRFPERFMFQLTKDEYMNLKSQIGTTKNNMTRTLPYVFTEQGVAMLSSVIKAAVAEEISVRIMDAFVTMKRYISSNLIEQKYINELVIKDSKRIDLIEESLSYFKEKNNHIFFEGQIYDAYSLMIDIFNKSKNEIVIVDNYIDKHLLDILSKTKKKITLVTKRKLFQAIMYANQLYLQKKKNSQ